ncbi:hypothetical protein J6590_016191 [Homalodisca vitripennis]|nr:hypothetical protein J6590_016191 [Homalodisca vitripennis]
MDRKFLHAKGKGCSFRLIADCISEDVIATCTDQRVLGIKDLAVATSPSARQDLKNTPPQKLKKHLTNWLLKNSFYSMEENLRKIPLDPDVTSNQ